MSEILIFNLLLTTSFLAALASFIALFFFPAPYGRHIRSGFGPAMPFRLGWMCMELPAVVVIVLLFFLAKPNGSFFEVFFLALWLSHYLPRAFVTPLTVRGAAKKIPILIVVLGFSYNCMNGYLNGRYLFWFSTGYAATWLFDPRFLVGMILFLGGAVINRVSDRALHRLRKPGESDYKIPRGPLFAFVSCPNYLGEIVQWLGWALATWSLPGLAFAIMSMANLLPRAHAHHQWYRRQFPDYPTKRKAVIPFVW